MSIYEPFVMKEIIKVACHILRNNFCYDNDSLSWFIDTFTNDIAKDLSDFEAFTERGIIDELHTNKMARLYFTCYFVSRNLHYTFINKMHFSEQELIAFESILPKYSAGDKPYETRPKY